MITDFQCKRCGNCCRHEGEVRLAPGEAETIALSLNMTIETFTGEYTRLRDDRLGLSLRDQPGGACIFLAENPVSCRIHSVKPRQCRDFPFEWKYEDWMQICAGASLLIAPSKA